MAYQDVMQRANAAFQSGKTKNVDFRRKQLENLLRMYEENKDAMIAVLAADLRRPRHEAIILEIDFIINDLISTLINLDKWAEPEKVNLTVFESLRLIWKILSEAFNRGLVCNRCEHVLNEGSRVWLQGFPRKMTI
jgi:acyl-CoA reductase-like NAD-dependent aldehyde dehydrogenase